jgi:hypothetical protein
MLMLLLIVIYFLYRGTRWRCHVRSHARGLTHCSRVITANVRTRIKSLHPFHAQLRRGSGSYTRGSCRIAGPGVLMLDESCRGAGACLKLHVAGILWKLRSSRLGLRKSWEVVSLGPKLLRYLRLWVLAGHCRRGLKRKRTRANLCCGRFW